MTLTEREGKIESGRWGMKGKVRKMRTNGMRKARVATAACLKTLHLWRSYLFMYVCNIMLVSTFFLRLLMIKNSSTISNERDPLYASNRLRLSHE